jgi:anti-anti-sigma regulatory factor
MCSLDAYSEAAARSELLSLCGPEGSARSILLHLGPQVFVGLRGLDVLLQAAAWARKGGRALLIIEPPECLTRLLDLLGMNDRLCLVSSTGQAARVLGINKPHGWVDERHGD